MNRNLLLTLLLTAPFVLQAQRGPGGVSDDSGNARNCRLWVDAGDLQLNDLDPVSLWVDKSVSSHVDELFWNSGLTPVPPTFRNAPSAGINGRPAITFDEGGMLAIGTWNGGNSTADISPDLNSNALNGTTYEQTMFFVFRTGVEVNSRQIIWEEGGSNRGFTITILNGEIYIGAYDDIVDNDTGGVNVPQFGFTYKKMLVNPNTTYTLAFLFKTPVSNLLVTEGNATNEMYGIRGTLNGQEFNGPMLTGCCEASGVGGVFTHPDPIGIGAQNRTTYNELGRVTAQNTGDFPFLGRIAEIIYYATALSPAERIIVENYLAAKYNTTAIANQRYDHQSGFAEDVIGMGQELSSDRHLRSQADNLFELSISTSLAPTMFPSGPGYIMTGHNNNPLLWTDQNVPDPVNVRRLRRTWRFDHNGNTQPTTNLTFRINGNPQSGPQALPELPALPTGFTKYGLLIESTSPNFPNFNATNSTIVELIPVTGGFYQAQAAIPDNAFVTICAYRPSVQFQLESDFAIEGNPDPGPTQFVPRTVTIELNFVPNQTMEVDVDFMDGSAVLGTDYSFVPGNFPVTFAPGQKTATVPFSILYDNLPNNPSSRDFTIVLIPTLNPNDPVVGARSSLEYTIYDDDPDPTITFPLALYNFNEGAGTVQIPVQVLGDLTGTVTATVQFIESPPPSFTQPLATLNEDFIASPVNQILTFTPGNQIQNYTLEILDDNIHEFDESIVLRIANINGVAVDSLLNLFTEVRIIDNDPEPTVSFLTTQSEGFRSVQNPIIPVVLSSLSAKEIEIPFQITGGTAINEPNVNADFSAVATGKVVIPPMDSTGILYYNLNNQLTNITVIENLTLQENRTITFQLDNNPVNAQPGAPNEHTYTIKWYIPFDFTGAGGVGRLRNNTVWMRPDLISGVGSVPSVPNFSETDVRIARPSGVGSTNNPSVPTDFTLNGHKVLRFNRPNNEFLGVGSVGSGIVQGQHPLVNMGGQYSSKSIYAVIIPRTIQLTAGTNNNNAQIIYEQGGQDRGMSLYLLDNKIHFHAWNRLTENSQTGWGLSTNAGGTAIVTYDTPLINDEPFIVSAHYDANSVPGLRLYINGALVDTHSNFVGKIFSHAGQAAIGALWNGSSINGVGITTNTTTANRYFGGDIAEFIYFDEPNLSIATRLHEVRNTILHNYLSAKFNIPLQSAAQVVDLDFADNSGESFNRDLAGIGTGMDGSDELLHLIAQGPSQLRVTAQSFSNEEGILVWGHNGESMTNTWPFSYGNAELPDGILERSGRIWKFYKMPEAGVDTVTVEMNFGSSANAPAIANDKAMLRLLTHSNEVPNDFSNAQVYTFGINQPSTGTFVSFSSIPVTNGMYLALGNTSSAIPLPIELLSFNARLNGSKVDLHWATASEINNDYFEVERASENLDWQSVLTVAGAGNSNSRLDYKDVDPNPLPGLSYYRLRQVDFDGSYSYSEMVAVNNQQVKDEDHVMLFPNPVRGDVVYARLPYAYRSRRTDISLFDLSGKMLWQGTATDDQDVVEIKIGNMPAGFYLLHFNSAIFSESKKLIIK